MASNPPGPCCFTGFKHDGDPTGKIEIINGVRTYVATPTQNRHESKAILLLSDVFGVGQNIMLLADDFAANGYLTFLPDLFDGENLPLDVFETGSFDIPAWAARHSPDQVDPIVENMIDHLRKSANIEKIGGAGYCFGGKYVTRFLQEGKLDAGYTAHPSFITFDELGAIKRPLSITAAENDHIFTQELRHQSENTLISSGKPFQINLLSGVSHGFAVRGDLSKPINKFSKEQAFLQSIAWFEHYLEA